MAYLDSQTLTCDACGQSGEVTWIKGVGPTPGDGPNGATYISLRDAGIFSATTTETVPDWQGTIHCPCGQAIMAQARAT